MKTYNNFILLEQNELWKGTRELSLDETVQLIKDKCSDFSFKDNSINRFINFKKLYYEVDPKQTKRKSTGNIPNIYTLILDENNKNYPKRSNSLICSYGTLWDKYKVIPFNNSKWGFCSKEDIWDIWSDKLTNIYDTVHIIKENSQFLKNLNRTYEYLNKEKIRDDNYNNMISDLDKLYKQLNLENMININELDGSRLCNNFNYVLDSNIVDFFNYSIKNNLTISEFLLNFYKYDDNYFSLLTYPELIKMNNDSSHEVWTDSTCLLIKNNSIDQISKYF